MAIENSASNNFFYLQSSIVLAFSIAAYLVWAQSIIKRLIDDSILLTLIDFCDLDLIFKGGGI